ncbi:cyclic di-AMP binding protein CbpA [Ornithinibacillus halophilus]|uniref:CBS domain-containing protein n=1 Tax=Ornithinibacillus halophilus TaxID=930117 RepID=A0A1M5J7B1_9BACI|nr:cyclic di-AMP binding protein CbpA [Ornithinibacillus halophilus]SHG36448.1 CBS domain-containing protein [Ornithinibacillus halophilus]
MLVKNDYVNKKDVVHVKQDDSIEHVLEVLDKSGYRCIPVLDESETTFVGNIYKVDLLEYEIDHSLTGPLSSLIEDKDGFVRENDPFFKVFSSIKRLPYLAVVNEEKEFLGILTNGNVLQLLEDAWGVNEGSYCLTVGTIEYAGALAKMLKVVNKHCNVQSVISLKNNLNFVRRVCVVLPKEVNEELATKVQKDLEKHNFTVTDIEVLN